LEVSNRVREVRRHAEDNREHHRQVDENLALLVSHTQRIGEALDVIKDIANKTDLLALNAALEGTKAGEAGRGFSIVATQMTFACSITTFERPSTSSPRNSKAGHDRCPRPCKRSSLWHVSS